MIKKDYMKPTMKVMKLQHQNHLLTVSSTSIYGLDRNLNYDRKGGDQEDAW